MLHQLPRAASPALLDHMAQSRNIRCREDIIILRSALYNWLAKIDHWPPDLRRSNMYLKTRPYCVLCLVLPVNKPLESAGQCSILVGQL